MRRVIICLVSLALFFTTNCTQDPLVKEANIWRSKVFEIPTEVENTVDCSGTILSPETLKILTVVQGNCGACVVNLNNWENLMSEAVFSRKNIRYYFLIESDDDFMNFQFMQEQNDLIDYPLIIDKEHAFFKSMGLSEDYRFQTFLLNGKNEVLAIGNPTANEFAKELYVAKIEKYTNHS